MGASVSCCVRRDVSQQEFLQRRKSWENVQDRDDFLTFFDCNEGDEFEEDPTAPKTCSLKPTWHTLTRDSAVSSMQHREAPDQAEEDQAKASMTVEAVSEDSVHRVVRDVQELWLTRLASRSNGDMDAELAALVKEGFPELEEWTVPSIARRMLRAACHDESTAVEILDKAIKCRVRRRNLFKTMRCTVTCDARVIGLDLQQQPVVYVCTRSQTAPLGEILPQLFLAFEAAIRIGHPEGQILLIADMMGLQARLNMDRRAVREFSDSFGTVFADRLNFILIVDFSFVAQALWSLCRPFVSERTRAKINFVSEEEARRIIEERLPAATREWVLSAFDINRDTTSTATDREAHAKRTSICDVPLGTPAADEAG
mmetsp:Transcript_143806/g.400827  ORF Transcript_143806/g.400827 Transcript_143806/m.400827 type:complete len:371 (-) Transcript_143806:223-1335(-)